MRGQGFDGCGGALKEGMKGLKRAATAQRCESDGVGVRR